jgi:hypothetical protein
MSVRLAAWLDISDAARLLRARRRDLRDDGVDAPRALGDRREGGEPSALIATPDSACRMLSSISAAVLRAASAPSVIVSRALAPPASDCAATTV